MARKPTPRRFAGPTVRAYLYVLQRGKCAVCSGRLQPSFHVDHRHPWSQGGSTCLKNLQALCLTCHGLKDGHGFRPRQGQTELLDWLTSHSTKASVVIRWPTGYGKSIGIALAYKFFRETGRVDRLLVITANDTQREQFMRDFKSDCATDRS